MLNDIEYFQTYYKGNYNEENIEQLMNNFLEKYDNIKNSKLKLFLSPLTGPFAPYIDNRVGRNLLSPFLKYGVMHASLCVDQIIIEWGNGLCGSHIVCPSCESPVLFCLEIKEEK